MSVTERAYLSIIEWPEAFTEERRVEAIVAAAAVDPGQAALAVKQKSPMVAHLINVLDRAPILQHLREQGVLAIAPTRAELARMPAPIHAKRLAEAMGSDGRLYMVEPWRGESEGLRTGDIRLLVRASVRKAAPAARPDRYGNLPNTASGLECGDGGFAAAALSGSMTGEGSDRSAKLRTTELLDIYTADKRRIRINGDKFGFDVLGTDRSYTDRHNLDELTIRLAERAPNAYIDQGFARFRPPPDVRAQSHLAAGDAAPRADLAPFDFYSPWFALVYAAMLKGTSP